ncbi:Chitin elicitor receptor kinase 1, RLK1 [Theobroma cacao]|uniref:non-specific serine/threonine protein kinase n=1 Tax=Theobroma cacao TaxID=3641 RepID=A0A061GHZ8_THECC|nr:Chitin elicitor receptor kinase 1, RLK1 [Theobroma cacao]
MFSKRKTPTERLLVFHTLLYLFVQVQANCRTGCSLAFASYYVWEGSNLTYISTIFNQQISEILLYNPHVSSQDKIDKGTRINVPFSCDCLNGDFLGHTFSYFTQIGDTYDKIASDWYANLTTADWVRRVNVYDATKIPDHMLINVTVNCSCGVRQVSKDYGLFTTYPLRPGENLSFIAAESNVSAELLEKYNPGSNFSAGTGLLFVPAKEDDVGICYGIFNCQILVLCISLMKYSGDSSVITLMSIILIIRWFSLISRAFYSFADQTGNFPPLKISTTGISSRVIAGISIAGVAGALTLGFCIYAGLYKRKKVVEASLLLEASPDHYIQHGGSGSTLQKNSETTALFASPGLTGITVDKSVEFSYEELAKATDDFSIANKIGQGGFGSVYLAELRGEKAAIKKMDMQASKEFLAELRVLTHVHHFNLVRLIGYCVEGSLFLVYEFIENGNLSQHLRQQRERDPLPWSARVQIALDSARGLEYIHEHTVPVYVHRDIKSANILIDKNFRAKVADFGLTKLSEFGNYSLQTRLVGTFGYMPPEYAQYGEVSPKVDVYAFGVVLFELISAREAIVKTNEEVTESMGLVALFEDVLNQPDPREDLQKLVDPRLGNDYSFDAVCKMARLARACTQENPQLRPSMRSIVVALMALSSSSEDWDVGSLYENKALINLMPGR